MTDIEAAQAYRNLAPLLEELIQANKGLSYRKVIEAINKIEEMMGDK